MTHFLKLTPTGAQQRHITTTTTLIDKTTCTNHNQTIMYLKKISSIWSSQALSGVEQRKIKPQNEANRTRKKKCDARRQTSIPVFLM
jgi:hypothetical protein